MQGTFMRLIQSTCLVLITLLATLPCQASAQRSTPDERMIMKSVAVILEQAHISGKQPDDEISRLAFDAWFDSLDPLRIYFEKKDIEGFMSQRDDLDDMLRFWTRWPALEPPSLKEIK